MEHWLKQNVCFEPLIWNWYAWVHLIAPATASANLNKRYLKILESYINHPELHAKASQEVKFKGGPYVDLQGEKIEEVKNLLKNTLANNAQLLKLSEEIDLLSDMLKQNMEGFSLEEIYQKIPESLRGCIELVYDMHHRASLRLIEPLFYNNFYNAQHQSILLHLVDNDKRPFLLSTPRLPNEQTVSLKIPFADTNLDALFHMRRKSRPFHEIAKNLNVSPDKLNQFKNLFTEIEPVSIHHKYDSHGIRVRYFGHACILIETQEISILIDPVISYQPGNGQERFSYLDLPDKIDYVLITHAHQDHIDLETLLQLRHQINKIIVPKNNCGFLPDPSLKLILENIGFQSVVQLNEMEKIILPNGYIMGIPFLGEHGDLNIQSKLAYVIQLHHQTFLFAVDSNNLDIYLYKHIAKKISKLDVLFIGMECKGAPCSWTYGPVFSQKIKREHDQSRRLNGSDCHKAWQMIEALSPREVYIYAMGQEPWLAHIMGLEYAEDSIQIKESNQLIEQCIRHNIKSERLFYKREWLYE